MCKIMLVSSVYKFLQNLRIDLKICNSDQTFVPMYIILVRTILRIFANELLVLYKRLVVTFCIVYCKSDNYGSTRVIE